MGKTMRFLTKINPFVVASCHKGVDETEHFNSLFHWLDDKGKVVVLIRHLVFATRPGSP